MGMVGNSTLNQLSGLNTPAYQHRLFAAIKSLFSVKKTGWKNLNQ